MVSNKILNTMREQNVTIMAAIVSTKQSGSSPSDKFGNQYWGFATLKDGIASFATLGDRDMVQYLTEAAATTAKHGLCTIAEVLAEPYVVAFNAKNNAMTDLTYRAYTSKYRVIAKA